MAPLAVPGYAYALVYNELYNVCDWHCNAFSGHFHCV